MIGAIAGDIIGSAYEGAPIKTKDFPLFHPHARFTDDSVLTVAVARAILDGGGYREAVLDLGRRYRTPATADRSASGCTVRIRCRTAVGATARRRA